MADTTLGDWPDETCDDCGEKGVRYHHWGPLTGGEFKKLCGKCMEIRNNKSRGLIMEHPVEGKVYRLEPKKSSYAFRGAYLIMETGLLGERVIFRTETSGKNWFFWDHYNYKEI